VLVKKDIADDVMGIAALNPTATNGERTAYPPRAIFLNRFKLIWPVQSSSQK
jgi:hypothetical protein